MSNLDKEIQGYLPYWIDTSEYSKIRMDLLSTIAWYMVAPKIDGTLTKYQNYPPTGLIKSAHDNGVKIVLVLRDADTNSSAIIDKILSDSIIRTNLIDNLVNEVKNNNFDGIDIDLELTNRINSINDQPNKAQMTQFVTQLSNILLSQGSNYRISIALPSVDWNDIWDMNTLQNVINYAMIMGYDYYGGSWTTTAGPNAPIDIDDPGYNYSIRNSVTYYYSLMNKNKLLLGIPYYGYKWSTVNNSKFSQKTADAIALVYSEIIVMSQVSGRIFDNIWKTPWFAYQSAGQWCQIHYDDVQSLGIKYDLVKSDNIAGIGIWALEYDSGRNELWNLIQQKFISVPITRYRCTGSPDYQCVEDSNGSYATLSECQTACKAPVACSIKVTNPSTGLTYKVGRSVVIAWTSEGNVGTNVKIQLLKAGIVIRTISTSAMNDGSLSWKIPSVSRSSDNQIKITSVTNSSCVGISGKFTIR